MDGGAPQNDVWGITLPYHFTFSFEKGMLTRRIALWFQKPNVSRESHKYVPTTGAGFHK